MRQLLMYCQGRHDLPENKSVKVSAYSLKVQHSLPPHTCRYLSTAVCFLHWPYFATLMFVMNRINRTVLQTNIYTYWHIYYSTLVFFVAYLLRNLLHRHRCTQAPVDCERRNADENYCEQSVKTLGD